MSPNDQNTGSPVTDAASTAVSAIMPPPVFTGEEIYDMIMQEIEPELTSYELPTLDEKYKDESPEAAAARAERYNKAFDAYYKRFYEYCSEWGGQFRSFQHAAMRSLEGADREEEHIELQAIESNFTTTPANPS